MKYKKPGFIVPTILISVMFIVTISLYVLSLSISVQQAASREASRQNAQFVADAGLDAGIQSLNADQTWTGTRDGLGNLAEITLYDDGKMKTTYQTDVIDGATTKDKTLATTGRVYIPATATTPKVIRKYELDVKAVTNGLGLTSVVSGVGGLTLNNNSKITGGDVVVNGTVNVGNNAQIGLSTTALENAVNLRVAHTNCPNPANGTYPRVCASGENGQPITANGPIYADVRATNQTTSTNMSRPGLIPNQTVAPYVLPDYDRNAQKAAVTATYASSHSTISCGNNQTKTWPANIKITGNINLGNNCVVTLSGNVWLTGNITFGNNSIIKVSDGLGLTRPTFMIDGSNGFVSGNNTQVLPNNTGTGVFIISYWSGDTGCSPDCNNVSGTALKTGQDVTTINLSNNATAPNSILYARWSRVNVSNNGELGAIAGQSIVLGSNAVINFTASVPGSTNLNITWVKRGYLRVFQ
ncbi:MAG: hypothetical protein M3Q79_02320 [bacterium]|nr:hypothetical protein [bacterium]